MSGPEFLSFLLKYMSSFMRLIKHKETPWMLVAILGFLLIWSANRNLNQIVGNPIQVDDPLGISGTWKYVTHLDYKNPDGIDGLIEVSGVNYIEPSPDKIGYKMRGFRDHKKLKNTRDAVQIEPPIQIDVDRISYNVDKKRFHFYFNIEGEKKSGLVELNYDPQHPTKMSGEIRYLSEAVQKGKPNTWIRVPIDFSKN
jgi:hypothetical protein